MLEELHIKNLILIDNADIVLHPGLNILTGETGAGKSIIIDSVLAAIGGRVDRSAVKEGRTSLVELTFSDEDGTAGERLELMDITPEEGTVTFSRRIRDGKSTIRINGETRSATDARAAAVSLINIYTQNESRDLLNKENHLKILDEYCGERSGKVRSALSEKYSEYREVKKEIERLSVPDEMRKRSEDLLEYEINEIRSAAVQPDEPEELEMLFKKAMNAEKIAESISAAYGFLSDPSQGAGELSGKALQSLGRVTDLDESLSDVYESISRIDALISDVSRELSDKMDELTFDEAEVRRIEARYDLVNSLIRKYGGSYEAMSECLAQKESELEEIRNSDERLSLLKNEEKACHEHLKLLADELSDIRKRAAKRFADDVKQQLKDLNFYKCDFELEFTKKDEPDANGADDVQFMISLNPGEDLTPLIRTASGGELSRIMLGIKSVISGKNDAGTIIFDEIDAGISGKTAYKVAEKLHALAREKQILCITHLPQIAAFADAHYRVMKTVSDGNTVTVVDELTEDGSVSEIARMMGGEEITEATLAAAREMKRTAL